MSKKDYLLMRGRQKTVGGLAFQVPSDRPKTDAEIVDREMLIEQIEEAAQPSRDEIKLAKTVVTGIRSDIASTANRRRRGIPEEKGLFDGKPETEPMPTSVRITKETAKVLRSHAKRLRAKGRAP